MTGGSIIARVEARQILDSRGRPTVEADVILADGTLGRAAVPAGASTGRHEAVELRDCDPEVFEGLGVLKATAKVRGTIADRVVGLDAQDQAGLDATLIGMDTSGRFETLGANAALATSLAVCRAAASCRATPLHQYISALAGNRRISLPMPMTNIFSGGAHARRAMDFQDFLAIPIGAKNYGEALAVVTRVRSSAASVMAEAGISTLLADEGGLSPGLADPRDALDLLMRAIEHAGLRPGEDVAIALDVAASELFDGERYVLAGAGLRLTGLEMVEYVGNLVRAYPIVSVEDPLDQDDLAHWPAITAKLPNVHIVGDDLFVTNAERISNGFASDIANSALIKLNQNGTLSGTLAAMRAAWSAGYGTVVSARSGETEDSFIADFAVGTGAGQIKIGSVRNSERMSKYNQLTRIAEDSSIPFSDVFSSPKFRGRQMTAD